MARWVNYSGSAVSVPAIQRDVDAGEEIEVPDDLLLPANIFRPADGEPYPPALAAQDQ